MSDDSLMSYINKLEDRCERLKEELAAERELVSKQAKDMEMAGYKLHDALTTVAKLREALVETHEIMTTARADVSAKIADVLAETGGNNGSD